MNTAPATVPARESSTHARPTHTRHVVLGLTVAAYMITYMDRTVISSAVPHIRKEFGLSMVTMGWILSSFRLGYSLFQIPGGWLGDWIGPRRALTLIVTWWSVFTSATALAWNAASLGIFRFLFGAGEAGAFPIATRSLSRWILPAERGFAQGITHAGSRLGAAATPPLVVWLLGYGWRVPFWTFGAMGILWAAAWYWYYRDTPDEHAGMNDSERALIHEAMGGPRRGLSASVPWRRILASPTLWYLSAMYFCYAYCISVYLDWFPTYLKEHRGYSLKEMGIYASLPLLFGTAGALAGGWMSDILLRWGHDVNRARRVVAVAGFLVAAAAIIPAALTTSAPISVVFSCVALFGLELTLGVAWAIPLDIGGDYAGSVSSVMNMCGNMGGTISPAVLAYLVRSFGWHLPFLVASSLCVIAAALFFKIDAAQRIFAEDSSV